MELEEGLDDELQVELDDGAVGSGWMRAKIDDDSM